MPPAESSSRIRIVGSWVSDAAPNTIRASRTSDVVVQMLGEILSRVALWACALADRQFREPGLEVTETYSSPPCRVSLGALEASDKTDHRYYIGGAVATHIDARSSNPRRAIRLIPQRMLAVASV